VTRPHEETWKVTQSQLDTVPGYDPVADFANAREGQPEGSYRDVDIKRCTLAAQAPAMARLLLSLQWSAGDCPSCGAWGRRGDVRGIHTPSCALVAVLRAAGVLP